MPELEFTLLLYSKGRSKVKHFLGQVSCRGEVLTSPVLQAFTGGPGQDVSRELNRGIFSFMIITWEAGFPEMDHDV